MFGPHNRWKRRLAARLLIAAVCLGIASYCWLKMATMFGKGYASAPDATAFGLSGFGLAILASVILAPPLANFVVWVLTPKIGVAEDVVPLRYLQAHLKEGNGDFETAYELFADAAFNGEPEAYGYLRMLALAYGPLDEPQRAEQVLALARERIKDADELVLIENTNHSASTAPVAA
jgi:hypothetical protein